MGKKSDVERNARSMRIDCVSALLLPFSSVREEEEKEEGRIRRTVFPRRYRSFSRRGRSSFDEASLAEYQVPGRGEQEW